MPSSERRRQIAQAALHILATQGPQQLTARELSRAVGITDGAIFRHFEDKLAIVAAALDRFVEVIGEFETDPARTALENLGGFFAQRVERVRSHPDILRLAFSDRLEAVAGEAGAARVRAVMRNSVQLVRECLDRAIASGELGAHLDSETATWMVVGAIRGAALSSSGPMSKPPQQVWQRVLRVLRPEED